MKPCKRWLAFLLSALLLCAMFGSVAVSAVSGSDTVLYDFTVDGEETWMGTGNATPYFAWKMKSTVVGQKQTAYQLVVTKEDGTTVWDTGRVASAVSTDIAYGGSPLESCTVYNWQVTVWDKDGNPRTGKGGSFETAWLEADGLADARWIKMGSQSVNLTGNQHYTVETQMTLTGGAVGLVFSASNASNMYMWQFNVADHNALYLRPHIWTNGGNPAVDELNLSSYYTVSQFQNQPHQIKLDVYANKILTYIDGTLVHTKSHTGQTFDRFGFRAANSGESGIFDDYKVTFYQEDGSAQVKYDFDFQDGAVPFSNGVVADGVYTVTPNAGVIFTGGSVPMFRKVFSTDGEKTVAKARLYTSGLGIYDVFLNGQRVGHVQEDGTTVYDELKPGWTDYNIRALYHTYDITSYLTQGENAILAEVGTGWWAGSISGGAYSGDLAYLAKIVVTYTDGTASTVVTDTSWSSNNNGPTRLADIYAGEIYNANLEDDFSTVDYDDADWGPAAISTDFHGVLSANMGANIRIRQDLERSVQSYTLYQGADQDGTDYGVIHTVDTPDPAGPVTLEAGQTLLVDFGQEMVGWPRFTVTGAKNTTLTVHVGEMRNDSGKKSRGNDGPAGSMYTANYRSAASTLTYILKGAAQGETYATRLTHYGFRYIEITATDTVTISDLTGQVVTSLLQDTGSITTSNQEVNQLFSNNLWGQYGNYLSVPTDCPQRDERLGWTGDTQVFVGTSTYNANVTAFFNKWVQDTVDNVTRYGAYQSTIPTAQAGGVASGWSDAGVIVPYTLYKMYGNTQLIRLAYPSMQTYITNLGTNGANYNGSIYGDWLAYDGSTPVSYCNICYYCYVTHLMSMMADAIGETADAAHYSQLSDAAKAQFQKTYVKADGDLTVTSQCAYLMALSYDLLPDAASVQVCTQALKQKIVDNHYTLSTGFLGTAILETGLSKAGLSDLAYDLLLQTNNPSWLYCIRNGATTVWERWNSYTSENGFGDVSMNSFNHYAYGCVAEWMYAYMAGIQVDSEAPGFQHFVLAPELDTRTGADLPQGQENITQVQASYESVYGTIRSAWDTGIDGIELQYKATVPANTSATVQLQVPDATKYVTVNGQTVRLRSVDTLAIDGIQVVSLAIGETETLLTLEAGAGSYNLLFTESEPTGAQLETYGQPDDIEMGEIVDPQPVLLGDLNQDGNLSVTDVVLLRKAILAGNTPAQSPLGDMNSDGALSVTDVVLLRKAILADG